MSGDECNWSQDDYDAADCGLWETDCGNTFVIPEGTPKENDMRYCCCCGKPLTQTEYIDLPDLTQCTEG